MKIGRPKAELKLSEAEQVQLSSMARSRSMPAALTQRARIVLACASGEANSAVAGRLAITEATVGKWRGRFVKHRIGGLYDEIRPGPPRTIDDERVAGLIQKTLHQKPKDGSTHWSVRRAAAETGISKTSVHRYLQLFGLNPHRTESFKLSTEGFFIEELRDVVGLYLNPPENALVLSVDEKSRMQALERTQPMLPLGLGYAEGITNDYIRHGVDRLQAAPPTSGVPGFLAQDRRQRPCTVGCPSYRGQLQHAQAPQGQSVAGQTAPLAYPLHPNLQFLAQSGRALLRFDHRQGDSPRLLHQRERPGRQDRSLRHPIQQELQTLHLDCHCRFNPAKA
jgi:transposase